MLIGQLELVLIELFLDDCSFDSVGSIFGQFIRWLGGYPVRKVD